MTPLPGSRPRPRPRPGPAGPAASGRLVAADSAAPPPTARALALRALAELEQGGGRANVIVPGLLAGTGLAERDRAFVTELVYGTTRMRRACDWLIDRHLRRPVEPEVRAALRIGAYQLAVLGTPPHAGVSATVSEVTGPARGLVNAVLRRVAEEVEAGPVAWPSEAVRLSYPDWVITELTTALGLDGALAALEQMNVPAQATVRADGYIQDRASQWAAEAVLAGLGGGERILDLCAAPGGKATWLGQGAQGTGPGDQGTGPGDQATGPGDQRTAPGDQAMGPGDQRTAPGDQATGPGDQRTAPGDQRTAPALVVAGDLDPRRAAVVAENVARIGLDNVATVVLDGTQPPFPPSSFDRVLVDAPCSGLGVLRRRPDARWRIQPDDVARLAELQRRLLDQALVLVRPGGMVVYSVCTLTETETTEIDEWLASAHPEAEAVAPEVGDDWERVGRGARLVPQAAGTDGMFLLTMRRVSESPGHG